MDIRSVNVEVLREGPRHNQLLSPLTPYLVVCQDSPAARLRLPPSYEHASFERRLSELRYEVGGDDSGRLEGVLVETGTEIGTILGDVPGLAGALSASGSPPDTLVHFRLTLSASELARIPFELSKVPAGAGASPDGWLLLQSPICLTRRNRSVSNSTRPWVTTPRLLFVAGPDVDEAFDAHLNALEMILKPWSERPQERGPTKSSGPWLTVKRDAKLAEVESAMGQRPSFVHFLAHGEEDFDDPYGRFGVHFADGAVSGERLASALGGGGADGSMPSVVTLATCDSSNEASPIPPDSSVAYALHSRGVPLVVASQFPLSIDGSLAFVEVLYRDLMHGEHPFISLYRVRLALHANHSEYHHDWASVTVHEALPDTFDAQLEEVRYRQSRRAHEVALRRVESPIDDSQPHKTLVGAVEATAARLPTAGSYAVEAMGLRAAGWKRLAEVEFHRGDSDTSAYEASARRLRQSLDEYRRAARSLLGSAGEVVNKKVSLHWLLTQLLSTSLLIDSSDEDQGDAGLPSEDGDDVHETEEGSSAVVSAFRPGRLDEEKEAWWTTAKLAAEVDRDTLAGEDRAWGHVSLIELWLLRLAAPGLNEEDRREANSEARKNADQLVAIMGLAAEQTVNTCRQIKRYVDWWGSDTFQEEMAAYRVHVVGDWGAPGGLLQAAKGVVAIIDGGEAVLDPHPDRSD